MSEASLGELYFGASKSKQAKQNIQRIELLKRVVLPVPIDQYVWKLFGKTKATMQKQGKTLTDFDLLIASTAKTYGLVLVTNDSGFGILDFEKENWV